VRLDLALVEKGIVSSRSRAKRAIAMGKVSVDGKVITKPSG
jgi:23S rRNA (cytidine1920-2'-O)/16S rRNA (cytidine1409-2'-O)-methyltransferase